MGGYLGRRLTDQRAAVAIGIFEAAKDISEHAQHVVVSLVRMLVFSRIPAGPRTHSGACRSAMCVVYSILANAVCNLQNSERADAAMSVIYSVLAHADSVTCAIYSILAHADAQRAESAKKCRTCRTCVELVVELVVQYVELVELVDN